MKREFIPCIKKQYAPADHRDVNDKTEKNYGLKPYWKNSGVTTGRENPKTKIGQLYKRNWRAEEKQGYDMGSVDPHRAALRGGLKSLRQKNAQEQKMHTFYTHGKRFKPGQYEANKVNDPRGNHEGGPGSWRDFKDENDSFTHPQGKNLCSYWLIGTEPHNFSKEFHCDIDHFAVFPEALCELPIKAGCSEGGVVLDPFAGSGTVGVVAKKLNRKAILIELNKDYVDKICIPRLNKVQKELFVI